MGSSAVVAVKKALRDLLQANPALEGVQVAYGWPGDDLVERERVFFGRAEFDHEPAGMRTGRTPRDERCRLDVIVDVEGVGESAEWADERVIALGCLVEETIADHTGIVYSDPAAGISVRAVTVRRGELVNAYNDRGALSRLTYTVLIDARLT